jgi:hypothetical protein
MNGMLKSDTGEDILDLDSSAEEIDLDDGKTLLGLAPREKSLEKKPNRLGFFAHRGPWRVCL